MAPTERKTVITVIKTFSLGRGEETKHSWEEQLLQPLQGKREYHNI